MPTQDAAHIKEKIISLFQRNGPSLPIHVAKETGLSLLFSSAFLSELLSEKKIKLSNMRVGSSPIYFLPEHESQLEKFAHHLKSKEKDAFILIQAKKILKDSQQEPAIRVALRSIRDFAIPFKNDDEIYWRYFTTTEEEIRNMFEEKPIAPSPQVNPSPSTQSLPNPEPEKEEKIIPQEDQIESNEQEKVTLTLQKKEKPKKTVQKKKPQKQDDKFFNKLKESLSSKGIEILDIENVSKNGIILKVKEHKKEKLLIAFNKKKIDESDIIKAAKEAKNAALPYSIFSLGEPSKKITGFIEAIRDLDEINKIE